MSASKGTLKIVRGVGKDGEESLQEYRFGSKNAGHQVCTSNFIPPSFGRDAYRKYPQFCGTCGTHILGMAYDPDAKAMMYNVNDCLTRVFVAAYYE